MDLGRIEAIIEVVKDAAVTEVAVRQNGSSVVVKKPLGKPKAAAAPRKAAAPKPAESAQAAAVAVDETVVHAPMVGIFHTLDGVAAAGKGVKKGQVLGAIESMKLMNEIRSDADGVVAEVYVEDGTPVEFGQALFRLGKA